MTPFISKAPANLMLMGEHAVVYGHPAIACAIDQWISIAWQPTTPNQLIIDSKLGHHQTDFQTLADHPKLRFILEAFQAFQPQLQRLPFGLHLTVQSDFSSTIGFGSSAAVLAATLGGLNHLLQLNRTTEQLFQIGLNIIHAIQKRGSGTDLAASLTGGLLHFQPATAQQPAQLIPLPFQPFGLSLVYCGYKTPTAEVLSQVQQQWQIQPQLLEQLYQLMGDTTHTAIQALQQQDLTSFFKLINTYQGLMDALGVNDATLSQWVYQLRTLGCPASKISGSGLGDCVLGLYLDPIEFTCSAPYQTFQPQITSKGMHIL